MYQVVQRTVRPTTYVKSSAQLVAKNYRQTELTSGDEIAGNIVTRKLVCRTLDNNV